MTAAVATHGLTKRYGELAAVDELDLSIDRGVLYGFLGPNGAGKTSTIRMLLGLVYPTAGRVELLGEPVVDGRGPGLGPGPRARLALRRVGAIVEEPAFWRYLSGRRNLEYFARAAGPAADRRARLARVDEVLALVDLTAAAGKRVKAYSQGMRQRLGIALALLGAPEVLVLDEPTNGLDPQGMREVRLLLRRLADEGTTVFVSSHLLAEVEAMCDRVGVLAHGRLVAEGPPSGLRRGAARGSSLEAREVLRVEVDDAARARAVLATCPGVVEEPAPDVAALGARMAAPGGLRPEPPWQQRVAVLHLRLAPPATAAGLNAALVGAGLAVSALAPEVERLEDVFLALTEDGDVPR